MFNILKRKTSTLQQSIPLEEPMFSATQKDFLRKIMETRSLEKVRLWLAYQLINRFLNTEICTEDFKKGWLSCLQAMDNLPIMPEEETPPDEFTSMQGVEAPLADNE